MIHELAEIEPLNEVVRNFGPQLRAFNALQLLGFIGSILSLIAARFSSKSRQGTWYNFMISWVVFCGSYLLLFFAGQAYSDEHGLSLCMVQSVLTYAASPFAAASGLALVIHLFFNVNATLTGRPMHYYWRTALLIIPYAVFIGVLIEAIIIHVATPNAKFTSISYCSLENHVPGRITAALDVAFVLPMVVLNFLLGRCFRKHWSRLRPGNFTSMFIRVSTFTFFGIVGVIFGCIWFLIAFFKSSNSNNSLVELDIILAMLPLVAVLIFGTHKDLLEFWLCLFWRKPDHYHECPETVLSRERKASKPVQVECVVNVQRDCSSGQPF